MRPRTHIPKPFERPGIVLSDGGAKRHWVRAHPALLLPGDVIQGHGLVVHGHIEERHDPETFEPYLVASFEMKNGQRRAYRAGIGEQYQPKLEGVVAFTTAEGEPVG